MPFVQGAHGWNETDRQPGKGQVAPLRPPGLRIFEDAGHR